MGGDYTKPFSFVLHFPLHTHNKLISIDDSSAGQQNKLIVTIGFSELVKELYREVWKGMMALDKRE